MTVRVLRKTGPVHLVRAGEGCRWLFEGRDFWAEESAPILVTGASEEARSRFLIQTLAPAVEPAGSIVVVFSPEAPGGILEALGEALRALFPELVLEPPKGAELIQWASAVDRATKRMRVDTRRRLLVVDGFDKAWSGAEEDRARFAEALRCVARQRSMAIVASLGEEWLARCAELPGFGHAYSDGKLVPIVCPPRSEEKKGGAGEQPDGGRKKPRSGRGLRLRADWRVWVPLAGMAGVLLLLDHLLRPSAPEKAVKWAAPVLEVAGPSSGRVGTVKSKLPGRDRVHGIVSPRSSEGEKAQPVR